MSQVNRTIVSPNYEIFQINVAAENVLPNFEKQLKDYAKTTSIPGFRKGMVPLSLVKKMYGESIFTREIYDSAEKQLMEYIRNEKIEVLGQPLLSKIPDHQPDFLKPEITYQFEFEVGIRPTPILPAIEDKEFVKYQIDITDAVVQENIDRLVQEYGNKIVQDKVENDKTIINFTLSSNISKEHVSAVMVFTKGFQEKLKGKSVNETVQIVPDQDVEDKNKPHLFSIWGIDTATAQQKLILCITQIHAIESAPLTKELFEKVYPNQAVGTEEIFTSKVKEETIAYFGQQVNHQFNHSLEHYLMDNTKLELPVDFLKKWFSTTGEKKKTEEEVNQELPKLLLQLRWNFIVDELTKVSGIEVSTEEVKGELENRIKSYFGDSISNEMLNDHVNRLLQNQEYLYSTEQQLLTNKLFAWISTKAKIKTKNVSLEDFIKEQNQHQAEHHTQASSH